MNKAKLIKRVSHNTGVTREAITLVVEEMIEQITQAIKNDEGVSLQGLGKFSLRERRGGTYYGNKDAPISYGPYRVIFFKPSAPLRDSVRRVKKKD